MDLVEQIEQNRRRSRVTLRVLRLRFNQRRREDEMIECKVIFESALSFWKKNCRCLHDTQKHNKDTTQIVIV